MTIESDLALPETFRDLIADRFGLRFDDSRMGHLDQLLRRRLDASGIGAERYLAQLGDDATETGLLAEELTVGETYFFRNNDQFRAFSEHVLPAQLRDRTAGRPLSVLSAGCSSGEEPYTIAMLTQDIPAPVTIRAVDLNPAALRRAEAGKFGNWSLRETPPDMLRRWFAPLGRDMLISTQLRDAVRFDCRNLADPHSDIWQPAAYDVIFCRNVVMYFTPAVQEAVVARIARALVPGGYLFLGHAETLRGLSHDFHLVHTHDTFYYQRRSAGDHTASRRTATADPDRSLAIAPATEASGFVDGEWFENIDRSTRRVRALAQPAGETAPSAAPARWNLGLALDLLQRERFAEALALVDGLPRAAAQDPDVLLLRTVLLAQHGQRAAAADTCQRLLMQDEFNAGAYYVLALCFEEAGDATAAINHYDTASHLDAQFAMPVLRRGLIARQAGNVDKARHDLAQAIELLKHEDASRLLLFGGGFTRTALARLCTSQLKACGAAA